MASIETTPRRKRSLKALGADSDDGKRMHARLPDAPGMHLGDKALTDFVVAAIRLALKRTKMGNVDHVVALQTLHLPRFCQHYLLPAQRALVVHHIMVELQQHGDNERQAEDHIRSLGLSMDE